MVSISPRLAASRRRALLPEGTTVMRIDSALTYADVCRPTRVRPGWLYDVALVVAGSAVIAASAQLVIRVPNTEVFITGQTFAVLLIAGLLGAKRGVATVLAYIGEGAAGLPVFAGGGFGVAYLAGPTAGYLVGFVAAAWIVGQLAERGWDRRFVTTIAAMTVGTMAIFMCGMVWLAVVRGPTYAVVGGLLPFLPGAIVKIILAAALLPIGWKVLAKLQSLDRK